MIVGDDRRSFAKIVPRGQLWTSIERIFVKLHFAVLYNEMRRYTQHLDQTGEKYRYCT